MGRRARHSPRVLVPIAAALVCAGCSAVESPTAAWHRWMARSRREAAEAVREIRKDLDFHEGEGLESFGGGAAEQVRGMRGELDRSATIPAE